MFAQELNLNATSNWEPRGISVPPLQANVLEFQYELCQIFLKKTGQQLHQQQSQMMQTSSQLLSAFTQRQNQKDKCLSTDSGSDSMPSSVEQTQFSGTAQRCKRGEGNVWRKLQGRMGNIMSQIEENCSTLCLINIKAIISDYRRLLQKWWELQAREGLIERKNLHFQRQHQENLLLKQKLATQNVKVENLKLEVECLKQKNESVIKYTNDKLNEMLGNQKIFEINEKVYRDIRGYLEEKQKSLTRRTLKIELLEQELLDKVTSSLPGNSCENCCIMLRKLKESLLKFKRYLEGQGVELQNMFNKYKKALFSKKNLPNQL